MFYFSDFVATRILHELYQLCCEKRFRPFDVEKPQPLSQTTLDKYLIIPKDAHPKPEPQLLQPTTTDNEIESTTNQFVPRPLPRSSSKDEQLTERKGVKSRNSSQTEPETRSRSGTLPSLQGTSTQQQSSKRSQSRPKHDEEE